ncbi:MAG: hypothetical protein QOF84_2482 [Streptomyces sp.]|jgi:hypothetical protein|nr:hypothetical protein [Streptomyces sp.]
MGAARSIRAGVGVLRALALASAVAGCGTAVPPSGPAATASNGPAPHTTSPAELCTTLITYWAGEALKGEKATGLDYQEMGLSSGQNAILLDILPAARAERRSNGPAAAAQLVRRQATARCAERYSTPGPSFTAGPWPS